MGSVIKKNMVTAAHLSLSSVNWQSTCLVWRLPRFHNPFPAPLLEELIIEGIAKVWLGKREEVAQWFSTLAGHNKCLENFLKNRHLGPHLRSIILFWTFSPGPDTCSFKCSTGDSTVPSRLSTAIQSTDKIKWLPKIELKKQNKTKEVLSSICLIPYLLMPPALSNAVYISLLVFVHSIYPTGVQLLSTIGSLIHSSRFCPNLPLSSPHLPSGLLATHQLLPWNVSCNAMGQLEPSVILPCTSPNVPNAYELFSQQDIKFLESGDHSLKSFCICDSTSNIVKPSKPGWGAFQVFCSSESSWRASRFEWKDLRDRKETPKVVIGVKFKVLTQDGLLQSLPSTDNCSDHPHGSLPTLGLPILLFWF